MRGFAAGLIAAVNFFSLSCARPQEARHGTETRILQAETQIIQPITVADTFQTPGTVTAKTSTVLSFRTTGQILSIAVREGDRVRKGQIVAEIDNSESSAHLRRAEAAPAEAAMALEESERSLRAAEAALRAAETNRDLAAATRKRYDLLRERNSLSRQEWDEIEARHKSAVDDVERARETVAAAKARGGQSQARIQQTEAALEAARIAVTYSRIISPLDGLVTSRNAEPGMLAAPGMPIFTIEDEGSYQLETVVEESRIGSIALGQNVTIEIDALAATVKGRVSQIVPAAAPSSRSYTVKVALLDSVKSTRLRSGLFGRALFPAGNREIIAVPSTALIRRGQLEGVYIVQNGSVLFRLVKSGKTYDGNIEILAGLTAGTRIVAAPGPGISDGMTIEEKAP